MPLDRFDPGVLGRGLFRTISKFNPETRREGIYFCYFSVLLYFLLNSLAAMAASKLLVALMLMLAISGSVAATDPTAVIQKYCANPSGVLAVLVIQGPACLAAAKTATTCPDSCAALIKSAPNKKCSKGVLLAAKAYLSAADLKQLTKVRSVLS